MSSTCGSLYQPAGAVTASLYLFVIEVLRIAADHLREVVEDQRFRVELCVSEGTVQEKQSKGE